MTFLYVESHTENVRMKELTKLIKHGKGILSIADEDRIEFETKLIEYYEDENKIENLKTFLYEKCFLLKISTCKKQVLNYILIH